MDKRTYGAVFSGAMAAGAIVFLFLGRVIPTGQLGFAAVASLFVAAVIIDIGAIWAVGAWVAASVLGFILLPGSSVIWMFALFFGYYPIVKLLAEKRFPKLGAWIAKFLIFYIGLFSAFIIAGLAAGYLAYGNWVVPAALVGGGVAFAVFDIGYSKLIEYHKLRISRKR
ncbi:MAG: hypothetical protein GX823_01920 [Clostridiales bacterium]|nr:hypothetical protein [Clostridiales bacterium]